MKRLYRTTRAITLLLCRLAPNSAPLVDRDGRGNSDDGTCGVVVKRRPAGERRGEYGADFPLLVLPSN
jgi:hypothetical protein